MIPTGEALVAELKAILDDAHLDEIRRAALAEQERRRFLATAEQDVAQLNEKYVHAIGRQDGDDWVQPLGAHDAYGKDAVTVHAGKTWVSLVKNNVWEPGVSGWREQAPAGGNPPEFIQPTGAHDAYQLGDKVTFQGGVYESLVSNNAYSPAAYPPNWKKLS